MRRSSRLFEIIQVLRTASRPLTAREIAQATEVSKRTIYRDIASLQAMRVPIVGEAGTGYVMRRGYDLPPLMFSADEVEAVVVGLALLQRTGDVGLQAAACRLSRKIADVLPDVESEMGARPLHVSPWTTVPSGGTDGQLLREAIRDERKLRFEYWDAAEQRSVRMIRPVALTYYVDSVVLAGWCELRQDFRHFRIDRMRNCSQEESLAGGEAQRLRTEWASRRALVGRV